MKTPKEMESEIKIAEPAHWVYTTKCRVCGQHNTWFFCEVVQTTTMPITYSDFRRAMKDHIENPRIINCDNCSRPTVQDLISCSPKEGD